MYQQAETIEAIAEGSRLHGGGNVLLVHVHVRLYLQFPQHLIDSVELRIYDPLAAGTCA